MHRSVSVKSDVCQWETGSVKIFIINNRHLIELYTLTDQGEEQGHSGSIQQYQCNSGPGPDGIKNIRSHCPTFLGWDDCSKIVLNCATFHFLFLVEKKICGWFLEPLNEDPVNGIEQHATFQRHRTVFLAHTPLVFWMENLRQHPWTSSCNLSGSQTLPMRSHNLHLIFCILIAFFELLKVEKNIRMFGPL